MFGLLNIDEGCSLSMTGGRTVAHFKLVWPEQGGGGGKTGNKQRERARERESQRDRARASQEESEREPEKAPLSLALCGFSGSSLWHLFWIVGWYNYSCLQCKLYTSNFQRWFGKTKNSSSDVFPNVLVAHIVMFVFCKSSWYLKWDPTQNVFTFSV